MASCDDSFHDNGSSSHVFDTRLKGSQARFKPQLIAVQDLFWPSDFSVLSETLKTLRHTRSLPKLMWEASCYSPLLDSGGELHEQSNFPRRRLWSEGRCWEMPDQSLLIFHCIIDRFTPCSPARGLMLGFRPALFQPSALLFCRVVDGLSTDLSHCSLLHAWLSTCCSDAPKNGPTVRLPHSKQLGAVAIVVHWVPGLMM